MNYGLRKNQSGLFAKLSELFDGNKNYNVLFLGSSRAESHFIPSAFDSITGLNSFNIGLAGCNHAFSYGIFKAYLLNHRPPKYLVMNLDYHQANQGSDTIFEFPRFFPYLSNSVLNKELSDRDYKFLFYRYLPFIQLPYYGEKYLSLAVTGLFKLKTPYSFHYNKGFQPILSREFKRFDTRKKGNYKLTILKQNLSYLDSVIVLCHKNKIIPSFVFTPVFYSANERIVNRSEVQNVFKKVGLNEQTIFYDYSDDSLLSRNLAFYAYDEYHLKEEAALILTKKFAEDFLKTRLNFK